MKVLGIESTCDETACAVVESGEKILSSVVSSQIDIHNAFGGVVPELACRRHIDIFPSVLEQALKEAELSLEEIDLIAVANGPGLIGAILVGLTAAKGLAYASQTPLLGVNHIEAHLYASTMGQADKISYPALGVVISGGHTSLVEIPEIGVYRLIGQTVDDAIGEAFDKVAKILGLPYPGGPEVEKLARSGKADYFALTAGRVKGRPLDFSFSGLKTGVLYAAKGQGANKHAPLRISEEEKAHLAASFQQVAFQDLVDKAVTAAEKYKLKSIILGGGVSNNGYLRELFHQHSPSIPAYWPPSGLSLDNAAMIAGLGYQVYQRQGASDVATLDALTRIPFAD